MKKIAIETLNEESKNSTSHFSVVQKFFKIYGVIFKFMTASFTCAVLDYLIFISLLKLFGNTENGKILILYNCIARLVSAVTNYNINKKRVFKKDGDNRSYGIKYATLAIGILGANSFVLYCLTDLLLIPAAFAKIFTELLLFLVSFIVQQKLIFGGDRKKMKNY